MNHAGLEQAVALHRAGKLGSAEAIYRRVLAAEPANPDALHLLGLALQQRGALAEAVPLLEAAARTNPRAADFHAHLAGAYMLAGRVARAREEAALAVSLNGRHGEGLFQLGNALYAAGKPGEAVEAYRGAVAARPSEAPARYNLATALAQLGRSNEAETEFRALLCARPRDADAWRSLGRLLGGHGRWEEAAECYRSALEAWPECVESMNGLAVALLTLGKLEEAIRLFRRAVELSPGFADGWMNLGNALHIAGRNGESLEAHRRAHELAPNNPRVLRSFSLALSEAGRLEEAIAYVREAIRIAPDYTEAHNGLANLLKTIGRVPEAAECYRRAIQIRPDAAAAHSNLLFTSHYDPAVRSDALKEEHVRWARMHAAPKRTVCDRSKRDRDPGRRLRIGYVSSDFRVHPVCHFLLPVLEAHGRERFEIFCYSSAVREDDVTAQFRSAADRWRQASGLNDEALAAVIAEDRIDILVDLSGHTSGNRLPVFAYKPAPIQATWLGYFNTTGMEAIDYILVDRRVCPPEDEWMYVEKPVRLTGCYLTYRPSSAAPALAARRASGSVVFGCFNNVAKLSGPAIALWSRILARVPGSRLLLKAEALAHAAVRQRIAREFVRQGIDAGRLEMHGPSGHAELLGWYSVVDVALDPFPYNGGTTTCEALWMGAPVVTLEGNRFVSRVGSTILHNAGAGEFVARTPEDYIEIAERLAADREGQARAGLRERMRASPLCDSAAFTRDLGEAYREIWKRWCAA